MAFVRYHAGLEQPEENFDANQQIIIHRIKTYQSESVAAEGANVAAVPRAILNHRMYRAFCAGAGVG